MSDIAPNDPAVVAGLSENLATLINEFKAYVDGWQARVDAVVVRLQNAGASEEVPGVGHTGQVPPGASGPPQLSGNEPVDTTTEPSTEPTGSSTEVPADDIGSTPPEDTSVPHHFSDPSGDDSITDPSGDDVQL